jgi:glycosyltransferase involved in cell wall biosynthesis
MITILFDGWSLSYHPNSPSALHLLTILEACPQGVQPVVVLPSAPPEWFPIEETTRMQPTPNTNAARLYWEQRTLPETARRLGAQLIHLTSLTPALSASVPTVISLAGFGTPKTWGAEPVDIADYEDRVEPDTSWGFTDRIRHSLTRAALDKVAAILWPADLPYSPHQRTRNNVRIISPTIHPVFLTPQTRPGNHVLKDLPEAYFLYHGPCNRHAIQTLLRSWSWVAGPIGENCPLVLVGLDETERQKVYHQLHEYDLGETVLILSSLSPQELAGLYQGCSGLFHPTQVSLWEGPVRQALASGRPIVAAKTELAEALVGPAAYLIDERDARAMGAALITIIVEESIATSLSGAAQERSTQWDPTLFREQLSFIYWDLLGK